MTSCWINIDSVLHARDRYGWPKVPVRRQTSFYWKYNKRQPSGRGTWTHLTPYVHLCARLGYCICQLRRWKLRLEWLISKNLAVQNDSQRQHYVSDSHFICLNPFKYVGKFTISGSQVATVILRKRFKRWSFFYNNYTVCADFPTGVARHPRAATQWYRLLLLAAYGQQRRTPYYA